MQQTPKDPTRLFVLGTDTEIGKTYLSASLFTAATRHGLRTTVHKPVQSSEPGEGTDTEHLQAAVRAIPTSTQSLIDDVAPLYKYEQPRAPGILAHPGYFTQKNAPTEAIPAIQRVDAHLRASAQRHNAILQIIEGAGGLHVPMPGPTWQLAWLTALNVRVLLCTRPGLGTINHTLLTVDALKTAGVPLLGFIVVHSQANPPNTVEQNIDCIQIARDLVCFGQLPHMPVGHLIPDNDTWLDPKLWSVCQ